MLKAKKGKRSFRVREGEFADAHAFVDSLLSRKDVNRETAAEALLVFEALMQKLIDWGLDEDTDLEISGADKLGDFRIKVGFEGRMFAPDEDEGDSEEDRVLNAHGDKLAYSYHSGHNEIVISVSRSNRTSLYLCLIASLCAVVVYFPLRSLVDTHDFLNSYVIPLEQMYANAMLMIGAPMTFFALLKNLTDTYVVSKGNSDVRRLQTRTVATSVLAILLAFAAFLLPFHFTLPFLEGAIDEYTPSIDHSFADVVTSFVPPNIFEPFEAISPIPLMVVALLFTYALCSAGKYFDPLRCAMMACYTLFSRMLHAVIAVLPVFCFLAILDILLDSGFLSIVELLSYLVAVNLGILALLATYAIRLRAHGIKVIPFARKLVALLRENASIGTAIDAAPYNIRYCSKVFKMDRAMLERSLPVLAEINRDGNCFVLMLCTLVFVYASGTVLPWFNIVELAVMVLFLSFGAPNQPGSILIGILIITTYLNVPEMACAPIYLEAFLGGAQNIINVIGDIVMVAIEDSGGKARTAG